MILRNTKISKLHVEETPQKVDVVIEEMVVLDDCLVGEKVLVPTGHITPHTLSLSTLPKHSFLIVQANKSLTLEIPNASANLKKSTASAGVVTELVCLANECKFDSNRKRAQQFKIIRYRSSSVYLCSALLDGK